jgi:HK97 gp10 family phage protein
MSGIAGLEALIRSLEALPGEIKAAAAEIVDDTAEEMAADVIQRYPKREGRLRAGVVIDRSATSALRVKVRTKAPHAHLYEYGTVQRFHARNGKSVGTMPAQPTFIPAAQRHRRRMVEKLTNTVARGMTGTLDVQDR